MMHEKNWTLMVNNVYYYHCFPMGIMVTARRNFDPKTMILDKTIWTFMGTVML